MWYLLIATLLLLISNAKLEFSLVFFWHGEWKPLKTFGLENSTDYLKNGLGDLTEEGLYQLYNLGKQTWTSLTKWGLNGTNFSFTSTHTGRTLDSLLSFI